MNPEKTCPTCGSAIPADAVDGLCLKCLGRLGFLPEPGDAPSAGLLRLGDYELLAEIARGGMGVVYRARQLSLNRVVALKVLLHGPFSSPSFLRRFRNEAEAVASLRHPNIVAIHEIGEHQGSHFISLDFIEGDNFAELVRERPLPAVRAARYLQIIAGAVEHAHQRGVLHRDLKPSNILLDVFDQPRVTDFGLAKLADHDLELTAAGQVLGSPSYMPPEQALGKFSEGTAQSDVYSLGAILYELLTSRPPFQGETLQSVLTQVQDAEPVPPCRLNPGVPVDLQTICLKCLQKDPALRYPSAQALADDLGRFLEHKPIQARPVPPAERAWLWCRRRPLLASLSAGFMLAVIIGVTGILWEWRRAEHLAQAELNQRLIAENRAAITRLNLYAADVALASQAIKNGNYGLARRTLLRLRPEAGETDLRGFEWRHLWHLCRGEQLATLTGHTHTVTCTAFSPDGKWLATGSQDGTVRVWDVSQRKTTVILHTTSSAVWNVTFTPDGDHLFAGYDKGVALYQTSSWQPEQHFPGELAAISQHGNWLATAESSPFFWEPVGAVKLFNWRTGQFIGQLDRPGRALALSADGTLLAVAGPRTGITLWETATQRLLHEWPTPNPVWSLNFSPDAHQLISAGWSSEVSIWSLDGQLAPKTFSVGPLHAWSAVYSPDGRTIATTSSDQNLRLWDAVTLAPKAILRGHDNEVWCAAFSPDGQFLASGGKDQNVMLWSAAAKADEPVDVPGDHDFCPIFSPDGRWLATVTPNLAGSALWRADNHQKVYALADRQIIGFSSNSEQAVAFDAGDMKLDLFGSDGLAVRSVALAGPAPASSDFASAGMSPDGRAFFTIDATGLIRVWETDTGRQVCAINGLAPPVRNAVLSPGGKYIAVSVERDNLVHLWDCPTGAGRELAGHIDFVSGIAFSADNTMLATGSMDGTIRIWNVAAGESTAVLLGHMNEATDVAFSPDGRTLASLGRGEAVKLWHLPTGREVFSESLTNAGVWLRFSPDGRSLAVTTDDDHLQWLEAPTE